MAVVQHQEIPSSGAHSCHRLHTVSKFLQLSINRTLNITIIASMVGFASTHIPPWDWRHLFPESRPNASYIESTPTTTISQRLNRLNASNIESPPAPTTFGRLKTKPVPLSNKRKAPESLEEWEEKSKRQKIERIAAADTRNYTEAAAITIAWEDHDFPNAVYQKELHDLESGLLEGCMGVGQCERVRIPADCEDANVFVCREMDDFKRKHAGRNVLQLIYYAGHGGHETANRKAAPRRHVLRAHSRSIGGQSFELNSLLWNTMFKGKEDTVVLLDCCNAELAIRSSLSGCKDVFGACAETRFTLGPGPNSFTTLLIRAFRALKEEYGSFTMETWVRLTAQLAAKHNYELPIHQSFGDPRYQILFQPDVWMQKKRKRLLRKRRRLVSTTLQEIFKAQYLNTSDLPDQDEVRHIEACLGETFSMLDVYRTFRRRRDVEVEYDLCNDKFENADDVPSALYNCEDCGRNRCWSPCEEGPDYSHDYWVKIAMD